MSRTWHLTPHYMSGSPNSHAITKTTRTLIPVLSLIPTETLLTLLNPTNPNSTSKITKLTSFRWTKRSWRCCTCERISSWTITGYQPVLGLTDFLMSSVFGSIANLKGPYFQPSLCVWLCVSVCLWPALLPFNIDQFWRNFVTRTLLWSSLAATIMVHIGRRGTVRRLFENLKKFQLEMWANAQRDGRPAEYRWRPLFSAAVWLMPTTRVPCSNAAKTRKLLKLPGVPQTNETISAASGP